MSWLLLDYGGGFAFLDVVLVPAGDLDDVGAGLFDDGLAAEAAVELQPRGEFHAVELFFFGLGDAGFALLDEEMAGGAGADAAAGVVEEDVEVFGDVEEAHGLAVAVVGQRVEGEFDGLVLWLEGDADHVGRGWLGEIDFGERLGFVIGHFSSSLALLEKMRAEGWAWGGGRIVCIVVRRSGVEPAISVGDVVCGLFSF